MTEQMPVIIDDTSKKIDRWARADTLAFCAWIPLIRQMQDPNAILDQYLLHYACGMATLAADLHEDIYAESVPRKVA